MEDTSAIVTKATYFRDQTHVLVSNTACFAGKMHEWSTFTLSIGNSPMDVKLRIYLTNLAHELQVCVSRDVPGRQFFALRLSKWNGQF